MADRSITVQKNLYGVGFSPLSIGNKGYAEPEEMMANKDVGLFFIYNDENYTVSAEYLARTKQHLKMFSQRCYNDSTLGKVYKIFIDDNHVQSRIEGDDNILTNEVVIGLEDKPAQAFRFSFDVDIFNKDNMHLINPEDVTLNIEFSLTKDDLTKNFFIEDTLPNINLKSYAIDMENMSSGTGYNYAFKINTITFKVKEDFDPELHAIALYDILLALI